MRVVPEGLSGVDIGNVYFYHGSWDSCNGIGDGNGGVRIGPSVDDNTVNGEAYFVELINEGSFAVALEIAEVELGELLLQLGKETFEVLMAVDTGFSLAQQVEVGAIND